MTSTPHPCGRWIEWNGETGGFRYYDKTDKTNKPLALPFGFIVVGKTATVKGWHEASESGIMANEVADTTRDPFVVKSFKGGPLASGFYREIKDRVAALGGHYTSNIYLAYKSGAEMVLGCLQLKGAALMAWSDFEKAHRAEIWSKAVKVATFAEGKKGKVIFRTPVFEIVGLSKESDDAAGVIQEKLKTFHAEYFKRTTTEQPAPAAHEPADDSGDLPRAEREPDPEDVAAATPSDEPY